jgi:hypothetical protein
MKNIVYCETNKKLDKKFTPQSQYFVESHFAAITAASLLGYDSISLLQLASWIFAHSSR